MGCSAADTFPPAAAHPAVPEQHPPALLSSKYSSWLKSARCRVFTWRRVYTAQPASIKPMITSCPAAAFNLQQHIVGLVRVGLLRHSSRSSSRHQLQQSCHEELMQTCKHDLDRRKKRTYPIAPCCAVVCPGSRDCDPIGLL